MRRMLLVVIALASLTPSIARADAGPDGGAGCAVDGDCEAGTKCDTAHAKCVVPDPDLADNSSSGGCGCRFGGSTTPPLVLALAMLGLLRRR